MISGVLRVIASICGEEQTTTNQKKSEINKKLHLRSSSSTVSSAVKSNEINSQPFLDMAPVEE
jgi:hypothetical protein